MVFNEFWTKKDNDLMRQMIKEKKSTDDIINFFGKEKIGHHPQKKFACGGALPDFTYMNINKFFINEICDKPELSIFKLNVESSKLYKNKLNYNTILRTKDNSECNIIFTYIEDGKSPFPSSPMYDISFVLSEQYYTINYNEYENLINKNELIVLMRRLIYTINQIDLVIKKEISNPIYITKLTDSNNKTNLYRNIVEYALLGYVNIRGESSINKNKDAYYYYKTN